MGLYFEPFLAARDGVCDTAGNSQESSKVRDPTQRGFLQIRPHYKRSGMRMGRLVAYSYHLTSSNFPILFARLLILGWVRRKILHCKRRSAPTRRLRLGVVHDSKRASNHFLHVVHCGTFHQFEALVIHNQLGVLLAENPA